MEGDEDEQKRMLSLCDYINFNQAWKVHNKSLNTLLSGNRTVAPQPKLFNDREGCPDSWQLGESPDDFIRRLPPLTTSGTFYEWIWVSNPYRGSHGHSKWPRLDEFKPRGSQLLEESLAIRLTIQANSSGKSKSTVTRLLSQESKLLQKRICDLAVETNVLSGKVREAFIYLRFIANFGY